MVTQREYERKTEKEWKKVKVITKVKMQNGFMEIPAGTVCRIVQKYGGFSLKSEPCGKCGIRVFISRVQPENVEVLQEKPWHYMPAAVSMEAAIFVRRAELCNAIRDSNMTKLAKKLTLRAVCKIAAAKKTADCQTKERTNNG